jgi:predicted ribosome quality control (RQC) complex YloA/Tae2 family protein
MTGERHRSSFPESPRMASKGRPYRQVLVEGFEVLIGRSASDNDALTFRVAKPNDSWLHVAGGTAGSHVVIRNPERLPLPKSVVERAASYAAWYSKARAGGSVEVHYCKISDVRKVRGAPAGQVQLERFARVRVRPAAPEEAAAEAEEPGDSG